MCNAVHIYLHINRDLEIVHSGGGGGVALIEHMESELPNRSALTDCNFKTPQAAEAFIILTNQGIGTQFGISHISLAKIDIQCQC